MKVSIEEATRLAEMLVRVYKRQKGGENKMTRATENNGSGALCGVSINEQKDKEKNGKKDR